MSSIIGNFFFFIFPGHARSSAHKSKAYMWAIQNFFKDFQNRNNTEIFKASYGENIPKVSTEHFDKFVA